MQQKCFSYCFSNPKSFHSTSMMSLDKRKLSIVFKASVLSNHHYLSFDPSNFDIESKDLNAELWKVFFWYVEDEIKKRNW